MQNVGVSAMALAVPACRVDLKDFCAWTQGDAEKTLAVVGASFRMADRHETVYTLAANAVLRLLDQSGVAPQSVGYLALGTESSTDNATGAVIVKGLVDRALRAQGRAPLARSCEVPELKHACLGGVYGLKGALRYVATDGRGRRAIVVAADIAEYARGSSGEPTQGAGAVAMLVEENPALFTVDLQHTGSAAAYREVDFRKPIRRYAVNPVRAEGRVHDFPVFNGKYSTTCYTDAVRHALGDLAERLQVTPLTLLQRVDALFFHRPYAKMPIDGLTAALVAALAVEGEGEELQALGVDVASVRAELSAGGDLRDTLAQPEHLDRDPWPATTAAQKALRGTAHTSWVKERLALGSRRMRDLGNLYTAALPAWIAAGLEEAAKSGVTLTGKPLLAVGYGSGDAAEALLLTPVPGWEAAARRIDLDAALARQVTLTQAQYEALHDHGDAGDLAYPRGGELVLERIGRADTARFSDLGVEYYRYLPA